MRLALHPNVRSRLLRRRRRRVCRRRRAGRRDQAKTSTASGCCARRARTRQSRRPCRVPFTPTCSPPARFPTRSTPRTRTSCSGSARRRGPTRATSTSPAALLAIASHVVLRCEGLDTVASDCRQRPANARPTPYNMFRTWEFDAKPLLKAGEQHDHDHVHRRSPTVHRGSGSPTRRSDMTGLGDLLRRDVDDPQAGLLRGLGLRPAVLRNAGIWKPVRTCRLGRGAGDAGRPSTKISTGHLSGRTRPRRADLAVAVTGGRGTRRVREGPNRGRATVSRDGQQVAQASAPDHRRNRRRSR